MDHKSFNGPMEDVIVVVSVFAVNAEVFHRFGTFLGEHLQVDVAHSRVDDGRVVDSLRADGIRGRDHVFLRRFLVEHVTFGSRSFTVIWVSPNNGHNFNYLLEFSIDCAQIDRTLSKKGQRSMLSSKIYRKNLIN